MRTFEPLRVAKAIDTRVMEYKIWVKLYFSLHSTVEYGRERRLDLYAYNLDLLPLCIVLMSRRSFTYVVCYTYLDYTTRNDDVRRSPPTVIQLTLRACIETDVKGKEACSLFLLARFTWSFSGCC